MTYGIEICDDDLDDDIGCALGCLGVNPLYECEYGNKTHPATCSPKCGDGFVVGSEDPCDDGDISDNRDCKADCSGPINGYYCSGGDLNGPTSCTE